jgi:hypothetical protein
MSKGGTYSDTYGRCRIVSNIGERDPFKSRPDPSMRICADACWCGNRKHVEWPVCSVCRVILEKDAT